jgi:predicted DNA-binding transcriptional regulator AlpA
MSARSNSNGSSVFTDGKHTNAPPRLALRREDAALALGVSDETFDRYVRNELPVVRLGSLRVYPVAGILEWLSERASAPIEDVER